MAEPGCDDMFFDVDVLLPVKVRFLAANRKAAMDQWLDTELQLVGPMHSFSIGLPQALTVNEVTPPEWASTESQKEGNRSGNRATVNGG